ncbi:DUF3168 domain-containing protein [Pseudotabrizicola alkalilacus]|uniref:DUF3168 domain-containing protein n=1 Tax=Pseudotabrizicola alkalilacus TaxID=2305252 RepID=A0A411Z4J5_9RHOB|nr:DUF3168 domain-containing protein [Pseudotabrizicola alkalilacus]RGP37970.1 DUF3168 domain-containing protein [Pseudotabrizicola alkalilacus]
MFEPSLALQTAIRSALIASPAVTALVPADRIRAGSSRPDYFPTIVLAAGQTLFLGRASGSQLCARVILDLHVWALEDGADTARQIGGAVMQTLIDPPQAEAFGIDQWDKPSVQWMRDPKPELTACHGVMQLSGVVRWRI